MARFCSVVLSRDTKFWLLGRKLTPSNQLILGQVGGMLVPETAAAVVCVASQPMHCTLMAHMQVVKSYSVILLSGFV